MSLSNTKPCANCPWRKTSTLGGADIKGFNIELMRKLTSTVPPRGSDADGFYSIFACHHSEKGSDKACAGYIARHGQQNINVRILAAQDKIPLAAIIEESDNIDLFNDFHAMLDAYEDALK